MRTQSACIDRTITVVHPLRKSIRGVHLKDPFRRSPLINQNFLLRRNQKHVTETLSTFLKGFGCSLGYYIHMKALLYNVSTKKKRGFDFPNIQNMWNKNLVRRTLPWLIKKLVRRGLSSEYLWSFGCMHWFIKPRSFEIILFSCFNVFQMFHHEIFNITVLFAKFLFWGVSSRLKIKQCYVLYTSFRNTFQNYVQSTNQNIIMGMGIVPFLHIVASVTNSDSHIKIWMSVTNGNFTIYTCTNTSVRNFITWLKDPTETKSKRWHWF